MTGDAERRELPGGGGYSLMFQHGSDAEIVVFDADGNFGAGTSSPTPLV